MSHSEKTAAMYYQSVGEDHQRIKAYETIAAIRKRKHPIIESRENDDEAPMRQKNISRVKYTDKEMEALREHFEEKGKLH